MAEHMNKVIAVAAMLSALPCEVAWGQGIGDPMRPPAGISAAAPDSAAAKSGAPELQSVIISPTRRIAIISGQSVALNEKFGESRVVKITETEVTLRNGQDIQVLKLYPNVDKQRLDAARGEAKDGRRP